MEDLVQSAIAETIPELLAEARQEVRTELEHAAVTEASVIMQYLPYCDNFIKKCLLPGIHPDLCEETSLYYSLTTNTHP